MLFGVRVQHTHDLIRLFNALPGSLQASLKTEYYRRVAQGGYAIAAIEIFVATSYAEPKFSPNPNQPSGKHDLRTLLTNEKDAFRTWRYLHEGAKKGQVMLYRSEYYYLGIFAAVLEAEIERKLPRISNHSDGTFVPRRS